MVVNVFPVAIAIGVAVLWHRGRISFVPDAGKVVPSLIFLGAAFAVLVFLSWVLAPILLPAVSGVRGFLRRQRAGMARGGLLGAAFRIPLFLAGLAVYTVLWLNVGLLVLLTLADVGAIVAALVVLAREVLRARG